MARIKKEDHARILDLVDIERRAVREIAAEFGCTPAAIYALLTKLRREARAVVSVQSAETQPPLELGEGLALGEESEIAVPEPAARPSATPAPPTTILSPPQAARGVLTFERAAPATATATATATAPAREQAPRPAPASVSAALGGKLAKPGMGLLMRAPDGEETMTPFRSVDDLLSAIKPILRAGARSPEPVWFSLQPVDLSTIDMDAA